VLGASMQQIITMLSKDFLKLVLIGSLIAFPLAWWGMHKWLEEFAYKVNIGWGVFAVAAGLVASVALLTISFQAIKAAMRNPVKSLRTE
jgi:putative ABC transport system permease protein